MITIKLSSGAVGTLSDKDAVLADEYKWFEHKTGKTSYLRGYRAGAWDGTKVYLHRIICDLPDGMEVDHINGNGLDNRRSNLRVVSRTENNMNRAGVKGCHFEAQTQKWRAEIWKDGTRYRLGRFTTEQEAVAAYRAKRTELYPLLGISRTGN